MGAFSDFSQLYDDFANDDFFKDAYFDISWSKTTDGTFDPVTGTTTGIPESHSAKAFSVSSTTVSRKPQSSLFEEIKTKDVFALTRFSDLPEPELNQKITFNGKEYTLIETLYDAISLTYLMQLRV